MKIAVLSGKGGTGKTTVSAGLARLIKPSQYIDCDVEEPNGYIFLKPDLTNSMPVNVLVPVVNENKCTLCKECEKACQFNAIAVIKDKVLIFPELCHHCGACFVACRSMALTETERQVGIIEMNEDKSFIHGKLNIAEPIAVPIVKKLKEFQKQDVPVILDCSPGASCTVVQSIEDCDFCVLVTEPTPFGLHDLKIAASLVKKLSKPFGIVINKALNDNSIIEDFCKAQGISVLAKIPYSREIAIAYSNGELDTALKAPLEEMMEKVFKSIKEGAKA